MTDPGSVSKERGLGRDKSWPKWYKRANAQSVSQVWAVVDAFCGGSCFRWIAVKSGR